MIIAAADPDFAAVAVGLLGGLSLFLFGMGQLTDSLREVAGGRMRVLLGKLTTNRYTAAITGAFVTAVIQSSSVTTVLVVGFISAGLMSLAQSVGVIMGANVGTTITAQIIAFKVTEYALVLVTVGFAGLFFSKRDQARQIGGMIMGLGLIFFGMNLMSEAAHPLRDYEPFVDAMRSIDNPIMGIALGAAFTAIVQSSSATTGIVIVMATQGFITLEAGIALALGANIGTCFTAVLAALGKQRAAMQAALVHVTFNVAGALLWVLFIGTLADIVRVISPASGELTGMARLAAETPRQIANAHTVFNVVNTLLFIPFTVPLAKLVQRFLPEREEEVKAAKPKYLDPVYLDTPALAIERMRLEIGRLGESLAEVVGSREPLRSEAATAKLEASEGLAGEIMKYARLLGSRRVPGNDAWHLSHLLSSLTYLQSVSDTLRFNAREISLRMSAEHIEPSPETRARFGRLIDRVTEALRLAVRAAGDLDLDAAERAIGMKREIMKLADELAQHLGGRLMANDPDRLKTYRIETQAIEVYKRIYYFAKRIAKTVAKGVEELEVPSVAGD